MSEFQATVTGTVVTDVTTRTTALGHLVSSFRVAVNPRKFDRATSSWIDQESSYFAVSCWRQMGENAAASLRKGDPVVVTGKLRIRQWEEAGKQGTSVELEASAIGHDLARGVSSFERHRKTTEIAA
jgi:single-strand DNA-binding protein